MNGHLIHQDEFQDRFFEMEVETIYDAPTANPYETCTAYSVHNIWLVHNGIKRKISGNLYNKVANHFDTQLNER